MSDGKNLMRGTKNRGRAALRFFLAFLWCCVIPLAAPGAFALQTGKMAPNAPLGSKEAEEIHQLARMYRLGARGMPRDRGKAEKLFEEALRMGNAKSALQIGDMYFSDYRRIFPEKKREKYMIAMYELSAKMGNPDAYVLLAKCHEEGWGKRKNFDKAMELLKTAAEKGSPMGMEFYGAYLINDKGLVNEGREWLRRSIELGNGDAGKPLADSYEKVERSAEGIIRSLRAGAQKGSKRCLLRLRMTYENKFYGQVLDMEHAKCYGKLHAAINDFDEPRPIPDFDKLCPMPPLLPYKLQ